MRHIAALATAMALLLPSLAFAAPGVSENRLRDSVIEYELRFSISDTADSKAFEVRGMCAVTFDQAASDAVSLYAVPNMGTATSGGTLIASFSADTTAATVFQPGTSWVRAVATTADAGGSTMRIVCSLGQVASTGEACGTTGLAPYVGTGGRYKCEADYSYDEDANQLSVGEVAVDATAGENAIRMEVNADFTGDNPTATEVIIYGLTDTVHPEAYIETLDSLNAPSRIVKDGPDYYDMVLEWGVEFIDVDAEYTDLLAAGEAKTETFCMVKGAHAEPERVYATGDATTDITIPLTGVAGCGTGLGGTIARRAYHLMGDPFVKDAWCTSAVNLGSGGNIWDTADEIIVRFGVSNVQDLASEEFSVSIHDMTYGYNEILAYQTPLGGGVGKQSQLREAVNAYSSSGFAGDLSPGTVNMTIFTATIIGMTRDSGTTWNTMKLQCNLGILFKDTR